MVQCVHVHSIVNMAVIYDMTMGYSRKHPDLAHAVGKWKYRTPRIHLEEVPFFSQKNSFVCVWGGSVDFFAGMTHNAFYIVCNIATILDI